MARLSQFALGVAALASGFITFTSEAVVTPLPVVSNIPLCPGLSVVTAVSQSNGDYESIKTIQSISDREVTLKYSSERMVQDMLSSAPPHLEKSLIQRRVLLGDLKTANLYEQQFYPSMPDEVAGTTAIGTSSSVLAQLKSSQGADLGIFIEMSGDVSADRNTHPNVFDFQMIARVKRVEPNDVMLPVIVNGRLVAVPTVHVTGGFFGDKTEFYFLDDPGNPLTIKYRYGIGSAPSGDLASVMAAMENKAPPRADKDHFDVTKISFRCSTAGQSPAGGSVSPGASIPPPVKPVNATLEQQLARGEKVEIYDIYFSFNSADIRPESEPSLKEIADVMNKHPDWKLNVAGHTDNVGGDAFNQGLSERRAASVKAALVARYHIDAARLSTTGYGDKHPQDTNATLEGRARNRRVELTRQ